MYVVKTEDGEVVAIVTRKEDADALTKTNLDKTKYTIDTIDDDSSQGD